MGWQQILQRFWDNSVHWLVMKCMLLGKILWKYCQFYKLLKFHFLFVFCTYLHVSVHACAHCAGMHASVCPCMCVEARRQSLVFPTIGVASVLVQGLSLASCSVSRISRALSRPRDPPVPGSLAALHQAVKCWLFIGFARLILGIEKSLVIKLQNSLQIWNSVILFHIFKFNLGTGDVRSSQSVSLAWGLVSLPTTHTNTHTHRHLQKTKYITNTPYVGD